MKISAHTGGVFDTNCFLIESGGACVLIDAPQSAADWLRETGTRLDLLLITHGHIDHTADAAKIKREHGCTVGCHPDTVPLLTEPDFFRRLGFNWEIEPVAPDLLIDETDSRVLAGIEFQVLHVPGHCPGSICFFAKKERVLFGGDVLFAGGVGRWDLPGGDAQLLMSGIKNKVLPLGDDVTVCPGHGPTTTIGEERLSNPFLQQFL
jgi:hydroxyacylglutathione hydrolase